jgi:hypothetical protein
MVHFNAQRIDQALMLLGERLVLRDLGPYRFVICGGAALIAQALVTRPTTREVDVVALMDQNSAMVTPDPLPKALLQEAARVATDLNLPEGWLNNGPSKEPGGLFQLGLPDGLVNRAMRKDYGEKLSVYFIGRLDQIHFKLFAAVDSGPGRHVADLQELKPTSSEMEQASRWAVQHDPSEGFRMILLSMLMQLDFGDVAERL